MNAEPREPFDPEKLPVPVGEYIDAHVRADNAEKLRAFLPDATVLDEGKTHTGTEEIRAWMEDTSTAYTYTTKPVLQELIDESHVVVINHLEGNFPGGEVDLRFQFTIRDDQIEHLAIEV